MRHELSRAAMDLENPPERFWHRRVQRAGEKDDAVIDDLDFMELQRIVIRPWLAGRPFTICGKIIRAAQDVKEIRIVHPPEPQRVYADRHDAEMRSSGWMDLATDRTLLAFSRGKT